MATTRAPAPSGRTGGRAPRNDAALNRGASGTGPGGRENNRHEKSTIPPRVGGYAWRKVKGLLTIADHARPYLAPLPGDLIECGRVSR